MISGNVIVKDRIDTIDRCLKSMAFCDEIIVIDTGSTDGTLEYLHEQLKNRVRLFEKSWNNDFSEMRNFAIEMSKGDWIFYLDSDEYLDEKYFNEIKALTTKEADAWEFIQRNEWDNEYTLVPSIRLFKAGLRFELPVHETLVYDVIRKKYKIGKINIPFEHTRHKHDNYNVPDEHPLALFYNWNNNPEKIETLCNTKPVSDALRAFLYLQLAEHYLNEGFIYKSMKLCRKSIELIPQQNLGYMLMSLIYFKIGLIDEAIDQITTLINRSNKLNCNMFNDRYYTIEVLKQSLKELLEVKNEETKYLNKLEGK